MRDVAVVSFAQSPLPGCPSVRRTTDQSTRAFWAVSRRAVMMSRSASSGLSGKRLSSSRRAAA